MALLELRNLHVAVAGRRVVKGINLEIERGELHILMGPNGSGKSTLLKAIMGIPGYTVVEGEIMFEGRDMRDLKPHERARMGIAMAYQSTRPIGVTLSRLIRELCRLYGTSPADVSGLGLEELLNRELHKGFSGGESKRVELALTILQRPKLALLDEPDSGVDLESIRVVGKAINRLVERGAAVLLVTHTGIVAEYLRRVDEAHVMIDGRIVASGELPHLLREVRAKGYSGLAGGGANERS
ncbi:MAG: ABC transporter ATP-binding protein [Thermoprotei archaeon]|nr:MAG: ABC transporter ATP-binding protein [Thermoprotei archaeon]RLE98450.1 MAG: ABC transporter ATP-binding protein [Thermoprotei archaeon]